jgi:hypothetical protein
MVHAEITSTDEQVVLQSWLKSRSQQQLMVGHPLNQSRLPVRFERQGEDVIQVTNLADHPLPLIIMCVGTDRAVVFRDLAAKAQAVQSISKDAKSETNFRDSLGKLLPTAPVEIDVNMLPRGRLYTYQPNMKGSTDPLEMCFSRSFLSRAAPNTFWILSPVNENVIVPFSADVFANEKNLHVITGAVQW